MSCSFEACGRSGGLGKGFGVVRLRRVPLLARHGSDEALRVGMLRIAEYLAGQSVLDDAPRCITATRSQICAATRRSCVMKTHRETKPLALRS
jgi:hypothetical protein